MLLLIKGGAVSTELLHYFMNDVYVNKIIPITEKVHTPSVFTQSVNEMGMYEIFNTMHPMQLPNEAIELFRGFKIVRSLLNTERDNYDVRLFIMVFGLYNPQFAISPLECYLWFLRYTSSDLKKLSKVMLAFGFPHAKDIALRAEFNGVIRKSMIVAMVVETTAYTHGLQFTDDERRFIDVGLSMRDAEAENLGL